MRVAAALVVGVALVLGVTGASAQQPGATVELRNGEGQVVGTATLTQEAGGVRVAIQAPNMPPGAHGFHFHEVGRCDPPMFMTAGAHYNPTGAQHGLNNPAGPHAGDLPNLEIGADGSGQFDVVNTRLTLSDSPSTLFDADGSALLVHADADDNVTDPSGNSGGRIACGVVTRVATTGAAAQPSPAAKPAAQPSPAAKPAAQPPAPAPATKPTAAPVQAPRALPRTGDPVGLAGAVAPAATLGVGALLTGLYLRRRR